MTWASGSGGGGEDAAGEEEDFAPVRDRLTFLAAFYDSFFENIRDLNTRIAAIDEPSKRLQEVLSDFQARRVAAGAAGTPSPEMAQFASAIVKTSVSTRNFVRKLADTGLLEDILANIDAIDAIKKDVVQRDKLLAEYVRSGQKLDAAREAAERKLDLAAQDRLDRAAELVRSAREAFDIVNSRCRAAVDTYWKASGAVVDAHVKAVAISQCEFYTFAERAFENWRGYAELEQGFGGRKVTPSILPSAAAAAPQQAEDNPRMSRAVPKGTAAANAAAAKQAKGLPAPPPVPPKGASAPAPAAAAAAPPSSVDADPLQSMLKLDDVRIREGLRKLEDSRLELANDRERLRADRDALEKEREALQEQRRRAEHERAVEAAKLQARQAVLEKELAAREEKLQRREEASTYEQRRLAEESKLQQERVEEEARREQARQQREEEWRKIADEKRQLEDKRRAIEEERVRKELEEQRRELQAQREKLTAELALAEERRQALEREEAERRERAEGERRRRIDEAREIEQREMRRIEEERLRMQQERESLERREVEGAGGLAAAAVLLPTVDLAVAQHDYTAADGTELSFRKGDVLELVSSSPSMAWWEARLDGRSGQIPSNYVMRCSLTTPAPPVVAASSADRATVVVTPAAAKTAATKAAAGDASGVRPRLYLVRALFDYAAAEAEELSFCEGEVLAVVRQLDMEDWNEAVAVDSAGAERRGQIPMNFVQKIDG